MLPLQKYPPIPPRENPSFARRDYIYTRYFHSKLLMILLSLFLINTMLSGVFILHPLGNISETYEDIRHGFSGITNLLLILTLLFRRRSIRTQFERELRHVCPTCHRALTWCNGISMCQSCNIERDVSTLDREWLKKLNPAYHLKIDYADIRFFRRTLQHAKWTNTPFFLALALIVALQLVITTIVNILPTASVIYFEHTMGSLLLLALIGAVRLYYRPAFLLRRQLHHEQYRLCPCCLYCLHGLPATGNCPECGHPYDVDVLKGTWTYVLS